MFVYEYQTLSCRKAAVIRVKYYGNELEHIKNQSILQTEKKFSENVVIYWLKKKMYIILEFYSYRYEAIVPGNPEFIAEYREKFFYCESEEKLLKFMK